MGNPNENWRRLARPYKANDSASHGAPTDPWRTALQTKGASAKCAEDKLDAQQRIVVRAGIFAASATLLLIGALLI